MKKRSASETELKEADRESQRSRKRKGGRMEKVVLDCLKLKLKDQSYLELKLKYQSQGAGEYKAGSWEADAGMRHKLSRDYRHDISRRVLYKETAGSICRVAF